MQYWLRRAKSTSSVHYFSDIWHHDILIQDPIITIVIIQYLTPVQCGHEELIYRLTCRNKTTIMRYLSIYYTMYDVTNHQNQIFIILAVLYV